MLSIKQEKNLGVYFTSTDFKTICRTCLASEIEFVDIFTNENNEKSIANLLSSCVDFEVSAQDGLPKQVCVICVSQLRASYSFREKSRKSNELLLCMLADSDNKNLIVKKETNEIVNLTDYFINFEETREDVNLEKVKVEKWESDAGHLSENSSTCDSLIKTGKAVTIDCNICQETFSSKELLRAHKCKHYLNACGKCKKRYKSVVHLRLHKCQVTRSKSQTETLSNSQVKENAPECDPIKDAHTVAPQQRRILICHICNREYKCTRSLKYHLRSHTGEKPALCSWCGKSFREERGLFNHITTVHTKEKRFKCSFCPKAFPVSGKRRQHERIHTGEKPYQCELCNRLFAARTTLSAHVRRHTGEIKFRCTIDGCGIGFYAFSTYQRHTWKHTGKRPYPCEQCAKSYLSRQNLRSHVKSAHTQVRDEVCHVCGKMYSEKSVLNRHLRQIHSIEPKDPQY